jgi:hypothetical protein
MTDALTPKKKMKSKRSPRSAHENQPSVGYMRTMLHAGPRKGESKLNFLRRLGSIWVGRRVWYDLWKQTGGHRMRCAEQLGIHSSNVPNQLKLVGLTPALLDGIVSMPANMLLIDCPEFLGGTRENFPATLPLGDIDDE